LNEIVPVSHPIFWFGTILAQKSNNKNYSNNTKTNQVELISSCYHDRAKVFILIIRRYSIFFLISGFRLPFFFSFFGWHVQKQLSCLKSWLFLYVHSLVCIISDLSGIMKIHDKVRWMIIWAIIVNVIIEPMSFFLLSLSQIMLDSKHIQNNSQYW